MAKRPAKQSHYERSEAYAKQVSGEIIEQIKKRHRALAKALEAGGTNRSDEYSDRESLHRREQPVSHEPSDQRGPGRQQVGNLPADRGGGRSGSAGREGNASPVLPEPDGATGKGRDGEDPQGQGGQNDL